MPSCNVTHPRKSVQLVLLAGSLHSVSIPDASGGGLLSVRYQGNFRISQIAEHFQPGPKRSTCAVNNSPSTGRWFWCLCGKKIEVLLYPPHPSPAAKSMTLSLAGANQTSTSYCVVLSGVQWTGILEHLMLQMP
jgi:hypothetical protein